MPHPSTNPVGSVKQVSGVLVAVAVKSTVLRDVPGSWGELVQMYRTTR